MGVRGGGNGNVLMEMEPYSERSGGPGQAVG